MTGGARRLGAVIVRRLAADGHHIVIHYGSSHQEVERLAAEVGNAVTVQGDLALLDRVDDIFERARTAAGAPIDALVNSASAFKFDAPPTLDPVLLTRLHAIGHAAPALLACALARQDDVEEAAVVNILDQKIANLNPDFFSYTGGKMALAAATTTLAQALGPRVRVNAVAPGLTLPSGGQSEAEFDAVARANLLRRRTAPDDVADAVAFLLGARGIKGQTLFVDNGQRFVRRARDVMFEDADA